MKPPTLVTDNITELLLKIIEFTSIRQKILIGNINAMRTAGFTPKDLPMNEVAGILHQAVNEHARSGRIVLQDSPNVRFKAGGNFEARPVIDEHARQLFENDRDEYLHVMISKLLENSLNQKIATEMLRQKQAENLCSGRYLD
jgi:hypothetical protein